MICLNLHGALSLTRTVVTGTKQHLNGEVQPKSGAIDISQFFRLVQMVLVPNCQELKQMYKIGPLTYENPFVFDMALLAPVTSMMTNGIN
ncbi:hypothetical protein LCGC14_3079310, partial [marine sediment metagenome]